jgi:hypothetical protein
VISLFNIRLRVCQDRVGICGGGGDYLGGGEVVECGEGGGDVGEVGGVVWRACGGGEVGAGGAAEGEEVGGIGLYEE